MELVVGDLAGSNLVERQPPSLNKILRIPNPDFDFLKIFLTAGLSRMRRRLEVAAHLDEATPIPDSRVRRIIFTFFINVFCYLQMWDF